MATLCVTSVHPVRASFLMFRELLNQIDYMDLNTALALAAYTCVTYMEYRLEDIAGLVEFDLERLRRMFDAYSASIASNEAMSDLCSLVAPKCQHYRCIVFIEVVLPPEVDRQGSALGLRIGEPATFRSSRS